jgi:hypothetical protein
MNKLLLPFVFCLLALTATPLAAESRLTLLTFNTWAKSFIGPVGQS